MNMLITEHIAENGLEERTLGLRDLNPWICTASTVGVLPTSHSSQELGNTGNYCGPVWKQEWGQGTERQRVPAPSCITGVEAQMAIGS